MEILNKKEILKSRKEMKEKIKKIIKIIFKLRNVIYFFVSLILLSISLYKNIIISEDVLFWTFSTIVQSFIALLALLGMVAIYRLQALENELNYLCEITRPLVEYFRGLPSRAYTHGEIILECNKIFGENHIASEVELIQVKRTTERLNQIVERKKKIKTDIYNFIEITVFIVFISLIFLPWTPIISKHNLGPLFLVVVVILAVYSLLSAKRLIKTIL
jgi:hypothetical protein